VGSGSAVVDEGGLAGSTHPPCSDKHRSPDRANHFWLSVICVSEVKLRFHFLSLLNIQSPFTFDCTCQRYAIMIRLRALRTLPFSFRSLSSVNNGRVAIHRSPVFWSTQIRRFRSSRPYSLLDVEPSDDPNLFDILLTDVNHRVLHRAVSEKLGSTYLSRAAKTLKPMPEISGILFGTHHRPFFGLATTHGELTYNLHFLFDTGSSFTYLSHDVS
jgi:hypothetical protein